MHLIKLIFTVAFFALIFVPPSLCLIDVLFGTQLSCRFLGWHNGKGEREEGGTTFDGASLHGICSKCGAKVMQDSQGNWFA
jgi:hypothetical protein